MDGYSKTARIAAYLNAIDRARQQGAGWRHIHGKLREAVDVENVVMFRQLVARARKQVDKGRYAPDQLPLPGDEQAAPVRAAPAAQNKQHQGGRPANQHTPAQRNVPPGSALDVALRAKQEQAARSDNTSDCPAEVLEAFKGK